MLELKNQELVNLDKNVFDFNRQFACYYTNVSNKYGYDKTKQKIDELEAEALTIKPASDFDGLVLENIGYILETQRRVADYFSTTQSNDSIEDIVDLVLGDGIFLAIEDKMRNFDWETQWKIKMSTPEATLRMVGNDSKDAKAKIEELTVQIKEDIKKEGVDKGYIPQDFDFNLEVLFNARTVWRPTIKRLVLGDECFRSSEEYGKIRVNPGMAYLAGFHELLGHGSHQNYSKDMPQSLKIGGFNRYNLVSDPVVEGLADERGRLALDYIRMNIERLGMKEDELEILILQNKMNYINGLETLHHSFIKEKLLGNPSFDIASYIKDLFGNPRIVADYQKDQAVRTEHALLDGGYFAGKILMEEVNNGLIKKYGREFYENNKAKIESAKSTGAWSWKVYPKAVEYILESNID